MNFTSLKKKILSVLRLIFKLIRNKMMLLLPIGGFLFYRIKHFPIEINTSDFLSIINSKDNTIKSVTNLNSTMFMLTTFSNREYISYLPSYNLGEIYQKLSLRNIPFNYLTGMRAFVENPINQLVMVAAIFGFVAISTLNKPLQKMWKKMTIKSQINDDVFSECVMKDSVRDHIRIIHDQLKNPEKYKSKNIKLIKGCLLYGMPGTGKTLLARCLSKMEDITFISTCASEFCEIYVGSGPKKVREIFDLARDNKPAIIFIDELESIGFKRSSDSRSYANNIERYSTLNQLLSELDGITGNENVVVIAATNREDLLDAALTRPGRFDYKINLELPDAKMRLKIFKLYLNHYKFDAVNINDELIHYYAEKSKNLTGANIEAIVNEAATLSFSKEKDFIVKEDLEISFNKNISEFCKFNGYNQEKEFLYVN